MLKDFEGLARIARAQGCQQGFHFAHLYCTMSKVYTTRKWEVDHSVLRRDWACHSSGSSAAVEVLALWSRQARFVEMI